MADSVAGCRGLLKKWTSYDLSLPIALETVPWDSLEIYEIYVPLSKHSRGRYRPLFQHCFIADS